MKKKVGRPRFEEDKNKLDLTIGGVGCASYYSKKHKQNWFYQSIGLRMIYKYADEDTIKVFFDKEKRGAKRMSVLVEIGRYIYLLRKKCWNEKEIIDEVCDLADLIREICEEREPTIKQLVKFVRAVRLA